MACSVSDVLGVLAGRPGAVDVLGRHVLVVQAYDVPVITAHVTLFILIGVLKRLQIIELGGVGLLRAGDLASADVLSGRPMNAR